MSNDDLGHRFAYHAPKDQATREAHEEMRAAAHQLASAIVNATVPSREQSLALTKAEEAMMWANAAIARNGIPHDQ